MRIERLIVVGMCVSTWACTGGSTVPPDLLRVTNVTPAQRVIPVNSQFVVTFNQDLDATSVTDDSAILLPTERVNASFFSDFNNPPLSADRKSRTISADIAVNGRTITFTPSARLPEGTDLSLLLSKSVKASNGQPLADARGEAGSFQIDFATEGPQPRIVATSLPAGSPAQVPPNLRVFTATADQPLRNVETAAVSLSGLGGAQDAVIEGVQVLLDGVTLRIRLADANGCTPLCANADYRLHVGAPLANDNGQELTAFEVDVHATTTPDVEGPALVRLPLVQPGETEVYFSLFAREPAEGRLNVGPPGGPHGGNALGAGIESSFVMSSTGRCTGSGAARECPLGVLVRGLDLGPDGQGRSYGAMLELTDNFGNTSAYGEFELRTLLLPRLKITEVYNNPPGAPTEEKTQEFIEITNTSQSTDFDLSTMSVATIDLVTGAIDSAMNLRPYTEETGSWLGAGQRAVIGANGFDPAAVAVPPTALIMVDDSTTRTTLLGGLSSSRTSRKMIALFAGRVEEAGPRVSVYRAPEELYDAGTTFPEGVSAERLNLTDDDATAAWCHSSAPTPGAENSVNGLSACP